MSNNNNYRLTAGMLFNFLIEAKKPSILGKNKFNGEKDKVSNYNILENIIKIFSGNKSVYFSRASFKKETSNFKMCKLNSSENINFCDSSLINFFKEQYKNKYLYLLKNFSEFIEEYLEEYKLNSLLNRTIALIILDNTISEEEEFFTSINQKISKGLLRKKTKAEIEIEPFLLSVFHFIIINKIDNTLGSWTFLELFTHKSKNSPWLLKKDIGADFSFKITHWKEPEYLPSTEIRDDSNKTEVIEPKEDVNENITQNQIVKADRIYNQHANVIYNIEHVENLN